MIARTVLLNPGPVTLTDGVRAAMSAADWCHREPEYASLTQRINARLTAVYDEAGDDYAAVSLTGSGTCAVEAMLASLTSPRQKVLVVANGVYGQRIAAMLDAHNRPYSMLESDWLDGIDIDAVETRLLQDSLITQVVAVHHETTTGRLNDIDALGAICRELNRPLLLDAVSSFAAEEIRFADWNLKALASTANKCLHGVPGMAFVLARKNALGAVNGDCGSVYLDLRRYYEQQYHDGYSPFTQAVQAAFALDVALDELAANGGWQRRQARYREVATAVRQTLYDCGVQTLLPAAAYSSVMCSYRLPAGLDYDTVHTRLKERGFIIYAGQGRLSRQIFRIAHMGDIRGDDVERLQAALRDVFGKAA